MGLRFPHLHRNLLVHCFQVSISIQWSAGIVLTKLICSLQSPFFVDVGNQIEKDVLTIEKGLSSCLNAMQLKRFHFDLTEASFVMALPFAILGTEEKYRLFSLALKMSLWLMPSAIEKVDYTCVRYELRDSFANPVTDICDDVEWETHHQSIHEEIFAPKSATNWWCKTKIFST